MKPTALQKGFHITHLDDEILVYDAERNKAHYLNPTTAKIWQHCDGTRDTAELATLLRNEQDVCEAEAIVELALEQLSRRHLLKKSVQSPSTARRLARRDALKKLATIASIPAIMTVMARPAFAQFSPTSCTSDSDCVSDPFTSGTVAASLGCQTARCVSGNCQATPVTDGTPSVLPTGNACSESVCMNGVPVTRNRPDQTPCTLSGGVTGFCSNGNCIPASDGGDNEER